MSARSRRLQGSMGSSWGDADYSTDDEGSIQTASNSEGDHFGESDKESDQEYTDKATPLLSKSTRASLPQHHESPTNTPTRATARHSQNGSSLTTPRPSKSSKSKRSTPKSAEPSLIMPRASANGGSLSGLMDDYANGTPTRNSQLRSRRQRQSSHDSPISSSRQSGRRSSQNARLAEQQDEELGPWWYVVAIYRNILSPILGYIWDVFSYANRHFLKPILGLALGFGVLFFGIQMASGLVYSRFSAALAPICLIPGSSYIVPMCATSQEGHADFEELMNVQGRFEDILESSKGTSDLPSTIKDSELAIRDLKSLVKFSRLPSRAQLDLEFDYFVQTAKEASADLSRYNSKIGAVMDRVIGTNVWTYAVLDGLAKDDAATGSLGRAMYAITGAFSSPPRTLEERIFDQYLLHVEKNKAEIVLLIHSAQALLQVLTNMDERLDTIFQLAVNDDQTISRNHDELLSQLWTKLGGNSASVKSNVKSLNLLREVSSYRKRALKHVSETLLKLQEIQAELENLHEGVSAPEVVGYRKDTPITFHMELIEKSVERLNSARGESMRVEGESVRRRIDGTGSEGLKELGAGTTKVVTVKAR
jgi:hypothetical protein